MTTHKLLSRSEPGVSRREFFTTAGMTAGAIATLGSIGGLGHAPAAQAAVRSRQYFSNSVGFELDGQFAGTLLAADGGEPVITPGAPKQGLAATVRYEPLNLVIGDMSIAVFDWIGRTSIGAATGRDAAVVAYDIGGKEVYRLAMQGARLSEIKTDSFDASVAQAMRFNVKVAPGQSAHKLGGKTVASTSTKIKASPLRRSNFLLYIQGLESIAPRVFSIKDVGLHTRADGQFAPLPLIFTLPFGDAAPVIQWMDDTLSGKTGSRQGELQMLSPDRTKVAASVTFSQLTILRISCPLESAANKLQLVEVECQAAGLTFNMGELLKL